MAINEGNINLVGSILTHTLSGLCVGSIIQANVTGGTAIYSVSWSGVSNYSNTTFDLYNLCAGDYKATLTDSLGATGATTLTISALTVPTITASLSDSSCILDPNSLGKIRIASSVTETATYRYELRKDNKLINTHYGSTADTTHTFTDIANGMYTVSVIEERPSTITTRPTKTACTYSDFNDGGEYSGLGVTTLFDSWTYFVPLAYGHISFGAGMGPNSGGSSTTFYQSGLRPNGTIMTSNPYVWLYTGATSNRKTDKKVNWYLGASAFTSNEGGDYGPNDQVTDTTADDVGHFYYNTYLNKFLIWEDTIGGAYRWVTYDPRTDYGRYGNPIASSGVTGTSYGMTTAAITSSDYTVNNSGDVEVATAVVDGDVNKFYFGTLANNNQITGMLSPCSYNNYTWETTFRAASDNDSIGFVLASFRDDDGKYGASGVTHTLSMQMNCNSTPQVRINNNLGASAYAFNKDNILQINDCEGGCASTNSQYGQSTILRNEGTMIPFSGTSANEWGLQGSIRVKVVRYGQFGEFFTIQFTDTMGATFGGGIRKANGEANPYNSNFNINFNLLDKSTWSGNSQSAPSWAHEHDLCKYLGSKRIGYFQSSQPQLGFYHIQFSGTPIREYIEGPKCGTDDGPARIVEITATTGTTLNIEKSNPCNAYFNCNKGVPQVKPNVEVTWQNMPTPSLTINGLSTPNVNTTTTTGNLPTLPVYNTSDIQEKTVEFYFGGDNTEMTFETCFAKFGVYPYIYQTEELATQSDYEALFGNLPNYIDPTTKGRVFSAQTNIPLSSLSTDIAWEYIIRPSYLYKQKTMVPQYAEINEDIWIDGERYPTNNKINYSKDFYMVVVSDPPFPTLELATFLYSKASQASSLRTARDVVNLIPDTTATTYSTFNYGFTLPAQAVSQPLVTVNGLVQTPIAPVSGTSVGTPAFAQSLNGDYYCIGNTIVFNYETVEQGDVIQVIYDAVGNTYNQTLTIPSPISTSSASTIFEANGYYYVNLDVEALGAVSVSLNGAILINESDYRKVDESRIQLINIRDFTENDVIGLFYSSIYTIMGFSVTKNPKIPVSYIKSILVEEEIIVRLLDSNGNIITTLNRVVESTIIGGVEYTFELNPPEPGIYYYDVMIKRYYPLLNGDTIETEKITNMVQFEITRDVFYSPSGDIPAIKAPYNNMLTGSTNPYYSGLTAGGGYSTNY